MQPGDRLPSREELCESFDVSHVTVSNAVALLRQDREIVYRPGRGLFVAPAQLGHDAGGVGL